MSTSRPTPPAPPEKPHSAHAADHPQGKPLTYQQSLDEALAETFPASDPISPSAAESFERKVRSAGNVVDWAGNAGSSGTRMSGAFGIQAAQALQGGLMGAAAGAGLGLLLAGLGGMRRGAKLGALIGAVRVVLRRA